MTRLFAVLVILLGVSACEYKSTTRTVAAPEPAKSSVSNTMVGVGTQPPSL